MPTSQRNCFHQGCIVKFQQGGSAECEARRADARGPKGRKRGRGFWGGGSEPPSHQLGCLGERSSGVRGGAPENFEFSAFWDLKIAPRQCKMMAFAQVF